MTVILNARMLLRKRATQSEHLDDPARSPEEFRAAYAELARVNRLFRLDDPYTRVLAGWLGHRHCERLTVLDLGAGDGWLGAAMETWARRNFGWKWEVTNLDSNPVLLELNPGSRKLVGSVLELPFPDNTFDVVIASQMTHHLGSDREVVQHFREAWRVAARAVFITDVHRNAFLYGMVWSALRLLRLSPAMRADGLLSVRRGWRKPEWETLAKRAGIPRPEITSYFGSRIILRARKDVAVATRAASETSGSYRAADEFYSALPGK